MYSFSLQSAKDPCAVVHGLPGSFPAGRGGLRTQEFRLSPRGPQCWWWHLVSPCGMLMS